VTFSVPTEKYSKGKDILGSSRDHLVNEQIKKKVTDVYEQVTGPPELLCLIGRRLKRINLINRYDFLAFIYINSPGML
jgi:hypothetical protein